MKKSILPTLLVFTLSAVMGCSATKTATNTAATTPEKKQEVKKTAKPTPASKNAYPTAAE